MRHLNLLHCALILVGSAVLLNVRVASAAATAAAYAARAQFSAPTLSPLGTRVAMQAIQADESATLVVLDVSGDTAIPVLRLEARELKAIEHTLWVNEDTLLVWARIDAWRKQPEAGDRFVIFEMRVDQRSFRIRGADLGSSASPLLTAPFQQADQALKVSCRSPGVDSRIRNSFWKVCSFRSLLTGESASASNLVEGTLQAAPIQVFPGHFFASRDGQHFKVEGRRLSGRMIRATWDAAAGDWQVDTSFDNSEFMEQWDSGEEDYPELWAQIHRLLPQTLTANGMVVKASATGKPVGIQYAAPYNHFVALESRLQASIDDLDAAVRLLGLTAGAWANASARWLGVTEDLDKVLVFVESPAHPGAYYLWRRSEGRWLKLTEARNLPSQDVADTVLKSDWLPNIPVMVTDTLSIETRRAAVIMPVVASDAQSLSVLQRFDPFTQWLASNGVVVVRVPVGLPMASAELAWRQQVAQRVALVRARLQEQFKDLVGKPVCLYGSAIDGYAALAAVASDFQTAQTTKAQSNCVLALDVRVSARQFASPYIYLGTNNRSYFLQTSNLDLRSWRGVYGEDLPAGAPENWRYPAATNIFFSYDMTGDQRGLMLKADDFLARVKDGGGSVRNYYANNATGKVDTWHAKRYQAMLEFVVPGNDRRAKRGIVEALDIEP
ncbi:MAG: hypothetical protein QM756_29810 [Polyangiaceae bacterium]